MLQSGALENAMSRIQVSLEIVRYQSPFTSRPQSKASGTMYSTIVCP